MSRHRSLDDRISSHHYSFIQMYMKAIVMILIIALMIRCFPKEKYLEPYGSPTNGDKPGYWKLVDYRRKGQREDPAKISEKALLEVQYLLADKDSLEEPLYHKGAPYYMFSFFNNALHKTDSLLAVRYGNKYDRKHKMSQFWYSINKQSGFAAFLNAEPSGDMKTHSIELSNVMKSATCKPELDSLRYIYEPINKFR